jgi:hypothetical protein
MPITERAGGIFELSSKERWLWPLLPLVAAVLVGGSLLLDPSSLLSSDDYRAFDWLESAKFRWYAAQSLLGGHFALWNPWLEGGIPSYAHPSDPSLSPFFITALIFGPLLSMKVDAVLLLLLASLGSYLLARRWLAITPSAAALVGLSIACSGWLPSRMAVGFYESLWLCVVPLVAAFLLRCADEGGPLGGGARWLLLAVLLLAAAGIQMQLCLAFSALQLLMMASLGPLPDRGNRLLFLGVVVAALVLVALLGAVKFLPMTELLLDRGGRSGYYSREVTFFGALFAQINALFSSATLVGEYDSLGMPSLPEYQHVGLAPVVAVLALLGMSVRDRRGRALGALLLATLLLSWRSGNGTQFSLFELLAPLPVFSSVRDTARYLPFFILLWFSLLAGLGLQALGRHPLLQGSPRARSVGYVLLILVMLPGGLRSAGLYQGVLSEGVATAQAPKAPFTQIQLLGKPATGIRAVTRQIYLAPQQGQAVLYEPEDLPRSVPSAVQGMINLRPDGVRARNPEYRGELWLGLGEAQLSGLGIGVNTLSFELHSEGPAEVVINQNFHRGWVAPDGVEVFDSGGLVGVRVGGEWRGPLELCFTPRIACWGLLASILGLAFVLALLGWDWRRKVQES